MTINQKLGDLVTEKSLTDVERVLLEMKNLFLSVSGWIRNNCQRTDKSVSLINMLSSSAQYLRVAAKNLDEHISVLALATRNLYELNVRIRAILASNDELQKWLSEAITDKTQTLEGILGLDTVSEVKQQRKVLRAEIDRLNLLCKKYALPTLSKPEGTSDIAKRVGLADEHKAIFKLVTKLVHPSSYLINDYENAASVQIRAILQMHAQLYAWDSFNRVCLHCRRNRRAPWRLAA